VNTEVEFTDEFAEWWDSLKEAEQVSVDAVVRLLEEKGFSLGYPYSSQIKGSPIAMRELRIQHEGRPFRVLYAFDRRRSALLLIGGDKTGNARWYEEFVPRANKIYEQHLRELGGES
jgi:hypothetical protein